MNKLFFIAFTDTLDRGVLTEYFNSVPNKINFWFFYLPNSVFVRASLGSSKDIRNLIQLRFGSIYLFIVEIAADIDYTAVLPEEHVEHFRNFAKYLEDVKIPGT